MGDIGRKTPTGSLFLPQVGDWTYSYTLADGSDHLDPTWRLYLLVGESEWDFVIAPNGLSASITVQSEQISAVAKNTRFWLLLQTDPDDPPGAELLTGKVVK